MKNNGLHIPTKDLSDIYDCVNYYIRNRYTEYSYDELEVIRKLVHNVKAEYMEEMEDSKAIEDTTQGKAKVGRKPVYSIEHTEQILQLRAEGKSIRSIAETVKCSAGRVQKVIDRGNKNGNYSAEIEDEQVWHTIDKLHAAGLLA